MDKDQNYHDTTESLVHYLGKLTRKLRLYSSILLSLIFSNLCVITFFVISRNRNYYGVDIRDSSFLFISLINCLASIICLFMFSTTVNNGMTIYEEITDEIDYRNKLNMSGRLPVNLRVVIRNFLKSTDLPFTTGKNGQAFYFVLSFVLLITNLILQ